MKVTPLDIRKQTFKKVLRGVDAEEVRMFLELVASEYEKVVQDNAMMAEKLSYQEERLDEYRELEKSLRNSLVTAERISAESREASDREAERIIGDAQKRAERILEDSRERLQRLVQEVENLRNKKSVYVRRFRTMIESQMGVLQEHEQQFDEIETLEVSARDLMVRSNRADEPSYAPRRSAEIVSIRAARDANPREEGESEDRRSSAGSRIAEARALAARTRDEARPLPEAEGDDDDAYADDEPARSRPERVDHGAAGFRRAEAETATEDAEEDAFFEVRQRREGFFELDAEVAGEKRGVSPSRRNGY